MRKTLLTQNGHEDIEVGGISNQQLTIWPGVRLLEINQYEAEASKTRSRLAHLRLGDPGSSSTGTAIRTHGPFLAIPTRSLPVGYSICSWLSEWQQAAIRHILQPLFSQS